MSMKKKISGNFQKCLLLLIIFILSYNLALSQSNGNNTEHELWVNAQAGPSLGDQYLNVMASTLDVSYQVEGHWFAGVRGYLGGSSFTKEESGGTTIEDLGCMAGWFSQEKDFKLFATAGISYIHAQYFGGDYFYTAGVPFEAGAFYSPHHVGFGVSVYGNINGKIKYYGIQVGFQLRFY
jgi:hypothetical protein